MIRLRYWAYFAIIYGSAAIGYFVRWLTEWSYRRDELRRAGRAERPTP